MEGALRFPIWSPTPREAAVWVVKPLRGEWQVLQATELSTETRFSSKIMSPSFALASVIGLSAGVNDLITSAEKRGTGPGAAGVGGCADKETSTAKKITTGTEVRFMLSPMIAIGIVSERDPSVCNYAAKRSVDCRRRIRSSGDALRVVGGSSATRTKPVAMSLGGHRRTSGASYQTRARELTSAELWFSVPLPGMSTQRSKRTKNKDLYRAVT